MLLWLQNLVENKKNILCCQKRWGIVLKRNSISDKMKELENKIGNKRSMKKGKKRKERIVSRLLYCKANHFITLQSGTFIV